MERLADKFEVSLVGHRGAMEDLVFKILAESVTLGRHPQNDIVLEDATVSGEHARITYDGLGFEITDLGSKTGVRVNTRPVTQSEIRDGDKIRIGGSVFIFSVKSKGGVAAPSAPESNLMAQRPQLDTAAKIRMTIYAFFGVIFLLIIIAMLSQDPNQKSGAKGEGADELAAIGPLAVEQYTLPTHKATNDQLREAALHLQRGVIAMDSGNLLEAITELKASLQANPACDGCKTQLDWTFLQLRKRIAYHNAAGEDDFKNLRYPDAIRHWEVVLKLVQPSDRIAGELTRRVELAKQKQDELDRRAIGLP